MLNRLISKFNFNCIAKLWTPIFLALIIFSIESYGQCNGRYQEEIFDSVVTTTIKYGESRNSNGVLQELYMDVYTPFGDIEEDRPIILLAHGGAFLEIVADRKSGEIVKICNKLVRMGYVCASFDYRLESNPLDLAFEPEIIKAIFRTVQDGKAAIRYFKKSAEEDNLFNIDPNQIIMGGVSAGSILTLNLGYVTDLDLLPPFWQIWLQQIGGGLEGNSGNPGYDTKIKGIINIAGAFAKGYFIDGNNIPMLHIHGTVDPIVPFGAGKPLGIPTFPTLFGSKIIHERAIEKGIESTLIKYQGRGHVPFLNFPDYMFSDDVPFINEEIFDSTIRHIRDFAYSLLDCNPDNQIITSLSDDMVNASIALYPNPTSGQINLNVPDYLADAEVKIYAIDGSETKSIYMNGTTLSSNLALPSGIYSLSIIDDKGITYNRRFIVVN